MTSEQAIVPRWEWRTFGDAFGAAEDVLAGLTSDRARESDEIYLLSTASNTSVKLRDELVDVKRLDRVNEDGLELWIPEMKEAFPLTRDHVATVLEAVAATGHRLDRDRY
jgi:exopolyphosphatase/guanosine-5'-triphosphate,3'-diphosphate pyrophosphatase